MAEDFSRTYIGNVDGFIKQIAEDPGAAKNMNYKESWNFIKTTGCNSLQRHTNLDILLLGLKNQDANQ